MKKYIIFIFLILLLITHFTNLLVFNWTIIINPITREQWINCIPNKEFQIIRQYYGINLRIDKLYNFYYHNKDKTDTLGENLMDINLTWGEQSTFKELK